MKVQIEHDYLVAEVVTCIEGNTCIVVTCYDLDHFRALPSVVSHNGIKCGKTGWNSDTNRAHYQSNAHIVRRSNIEPQVIGGFFRYGD